MYLSVYDGFSRNLEISISNFYANILKFFWNSNKNITLFAIVLLQVVNYAHLKIFCKFLKVLWNQKQTAKFLQKFLHN